MSKVHFFTSQSSFAADQLLIDSFGSQLDDGIYEVYNLQNRFSLTAGAPAFSLTKALICATLNNENPLLLNCVLKPIDAMYGFPVKYIIIRGIEKSSLIDSNGNIILDDSDMGSDNLLKIIRETQEKLNAENGTEDVANQQTLGLNVDSITNSTTLDAVFFNNVDGFHPLIVNAGTQLGNFLGGDAKIGIEIILEDISSGTTIADVKTNTNIFTIEKLSIPVALSPVEKLRLKFQNRFEKEAILRYLDVTALYGTLKNRGIRVKGVSNGNDFLERFHNRNVVYIDVRDDKNFSFNHFFKNEDTLAVAFYNSDDELIFEHPNYYDTWPILTLRNRIYETSKEEFYLSMPITAGEPENVIYISSYTGKIATTKDKSRRKHKVLATNPNKKDVLFKNSEPVRFKNWTDDNEKLGSNFILIKLSITRSSENYVWNNFFSLNIKDAFNTIPTNIGEFNVTAYDPFNSPLVLDDDNDEVYYATSGIAVDKESVTFFAFRNEMLYTGKRQKTTPNFLTTRKYILPVNEEDFDLAGTTAPNVGFLNQVTTIDMSRSENFQMQKLEHNDFTDESGLSELTFLRYQKIKHEAFSDLVIAGMECISLKHSEYNGLLDIIQNNSYSISDFFTEHPYYLKSKEIKTHQQDEGLLMHVKLTLGVAKIIETDPPLILADGEPYLYVDLVDFPTEITVNGETIELTSILTN